MNRQTLLTNISQLITCEPLTLHKIYSSLSWQELGVKKNSWLLVEEDKIKSYGAMQNLPKNFSGKTIDTKNSLIMPGFVDSHTHPLFAGRRDQEFVARIEGATYEQIAAQGGGIQTTVKETNAASDQHLFELCNERLDSMLKKGVTTLECKSGYALSVAEELRHLKILTRVKESAKQHLSRTCLALHAIPPKSCAQKFISQVETKLLPQIAQDKLAEFVDVFIEEGFYSSTDCDSFAQTAKELGLGLRVHADELTRSGGSQFAAKWQAKSADHLQFANLDDFKALKNSSTVATILPGTSLCTKIPYTKANLMRQAGCAIAIASDYNPGSCTIYNLSFIATLASLYCGLSLAETIAGVTYIPAMSLGLEKTKGALAPGYDADLTIWKLEEASQWLESFGQKSPDQVWVKGQSLI